MFQANLHWTGSSIFFKKIMISAKRLKYATKNCSVLDKENLSPPLFWNHWKTISDKREKCTSIWNNPAFKSVKQGPNEEISRFWVGKSWVFLTKIFKKRFFKIDISRHSKKNAKSPKNQSQTAHRDSQTKAKQLNFLLFLEIFFVPALILNRFFGKPLLRFLFCIFLISFLP